MSAESGSIVEALVNSGYTFWFSSFSALDNYLGFPSLPFVFLETDADLAALARLAENLCFPGTDIADGAIDSQGRRWYFRCREIGELSTNSPYDMLSLVQDLKTRCFYDSRGIYHQIRSLRNLSSGKPSTENSNFTWWTGLCPRAGYSALLDAALILARYEKTQTPPSGFVEGLRMNGELPPEPEAQRILLLGLMVSPRPDRGLEFLKISGFLDKFWPEIARLNEADHSKEFHPEGNAWKHTLETFGYRKQNTAGGYDPILSLALLLHDIGKPLAEESGNRRFNGHAELGAQAAARFLKRLSFESGLTEDVFYLVKNHMLPGALARLPLLTTGDTMKSPLFPTLMELYRCDESSSFKGLENYYENSAAYQTYLRNMKNPFRSADGKKLTNPKHRSYHR